MLARFRNNPVFETIFFAGYFVYKNITCKDSRADKNHNKYCSSVVTEVKEKPLQEFHVAIICDELTYVNSRKSVIYMC